MEDVSINVEGPASRQPDLQMFERWKAKQFPVLTPAEDDHGPCPSWKMMDKVLYGYVKSDNFDELFRKLLEVSKDEQLLSSIIFKQVGPSGNTLLHVAAANGSKSVTELLAHHFPSLITSKNFQGDTALHLAARAKQLDTATILVNRSPIDHFPSLLRITNEKENTAMHDAVINNDYDVAQFLVSTDPEVSYYKNKENKSPLCLAVETSDEKMLAFLLHSMASHGDSHTKIQGKSPAHAAVYKKKLGMLKLIGEKKPELILCAKDEKWGNNPLHFASSTGYLEGVEFLLQNFRDCAIESNREGLYPIHVACKKGNVAVVDKLLQEWPDPLDFLSAKGKNILHVAAENGQAKVVKYILRNPNLAALKNEKDREGNTPLHVAAKNGSSLSVFALVRAKGVDRRILNGENLTPYNVAERQSKIVEAEHSGTKPIANGKDMDTNDLNGGEKQSATADSTGVNGKDKQEYSKKQHAVADSKGSKDYYGVMMSLSILFFFARPRKPLVDYLRIQSKPLPREELKSRIETLLVVAVLVAGVTFAGAIQLPGGKDDSKKTTSSFPDSKNTTSRLQDSRNTTSSSSKQQGVSEENDVLLQVYIYFDMIALNASVMAALILCWAQLYDVKLASHAVWLASILVGGAIYLMCLAFLFAVAIAVSKYVVFFSVIIAIEGALFLIQTVLSAPLIIPPSANQIIERILSPIVYFMFFLAYFVFERLLSKLGSHSKKKPASSQ